MIAFRDWLAEQASVAPRPRVINATGEGILQGPGIEQVRPGALSALVPAAAWDAASHLRARYRPAHAGDRLARAVRELREGDVQDDPAARAVCEGLAGVRTRRYAGRHSRRAGLRGPRIEPSRAPEPMALHAELAIDTEALQMLASSTALVPVTMPARTACSRRAPPIGCSSCGPTRRGWPPACGAATGVDVFEDGVPLGRSCNLNGLEPGTCVVLRGEVHFNPADGSDPRFNGRVYTVLLPPHVAYVEGLPEDVIARFRL